MATNDVGMKTAEEMADVAVALRAIIATSGRIEEATQAGLAPTEVFSTECLALFYEVMALLPVANEALRRSMQHALCVGDNSVSAHRVAKAIGERQAGIK